MNTQEIVNLNLYDQCKIDTPTSLDKIIYLTQNGANINFINNTGNTPLHVACFYECKNIIYYLLKNGADYNIRNNSNKSPIDLMIPPAGSYYNDDPSIILRNEIINLIKNDLKI